MFFYDSYSSGACSLACYSALSVDVDVVGYSLDVVLPGNAGFLIEDVAEGQAVFRHELFRVALGGVELGDAHYFDTEILELLLVEFL